MQYMVSVVTDKLSWLRIWSVSLVCHLHTMLTTCCAKIEVKISVNTCLSVTAKFQNLSNIPRNFENKRKFIDRKKQNNSSLCYTKHPCLSF